MKSWKYKAKKLSDNSRNYAPVKLSYKLHILRKQMRFSFFWYSTEVGHMYHILNFTKPWIFLEFIKDSVWKIYQNQFSKPPLIVNKNSGGLHFIPLPKTPHYALFLPLFFAAIATFHFSGSKGCAFSQKQSIGYNYEFSKEFPQFLHLQWNIITYKRKLYKWDSEIWNLCKRSPVKVQYKIFSCSF